MSSGDRFSEPLGARGADCGEDAAAYVLGALESEEAERFRRHLHSCVVCRDVVASLQIAADALPLAAPQLSAPQGLRRKVLASVRAEARRDRISRSTRGGRPSLHARARWATRAAAAASVAVLAAAAVLAFELASGGSGGSSTARVVPASVHLPTGSAVLQIASGRGELILRHVPAPPAGKIYEVRLGHPRGAPSPTDALFDVTSRGSATVEIPGDLRGVSEVLVTPERLGGSTVPTHPPVIVARLAL